MISAVLLLMLSLFQSAPDSLSAARAYAASGELQKAVDRYEEAIALAPQREEAYVELTQIFLSTGLAEEAGDVLLRAEAAFPQSALPHYGAFNYTLAQLYADSGRTGKALAAMERAATAPGEIAPEMIYKRIGDLRKEQLQFDKAESAYMKAMSVRPGVELRLALADLYLRRNQLDQALAQYSEVIRVRPRLAAGRAGLAEVHLRARRFQEAIVAARKGLDLDPANRRCRYILGRALMRIGRIHEGRSELDSYRKDESRAQAQEQRVRDIHAYNSGGLALLFAGRKDAAIALFRKGIALHPDAAALYYNLGRAQSQSGLHQAAIKTFQMMLDRGLGNAETLRQSLAREHVLLREARAPQRTLSNAVSQ